MFLIGCFKSGLSPDVVFAVAQFQTICCQYILAVYSRATRWILETSDFILVLIKQLWATGIQHLRCAVLEWLELEHD